MASMAQQPLPTSWFCRYFSTLVAHPLYLPFPLHHHHHHHHHHLFFFFYFFFFLLLLLLLLLTPPLQW